MPSPVTLLSPAITQAKQKYQPKKVQEATESTAGFRAVSKPETAGDVSGASTQAPSKNSSRDSSNAGTPIRSRFASENATFAGKLTSSKSPVLEKETDTKTVSSRFDSLAPEASSPPAVAVAAKQASSGTSRFDMGSTKNADGKKKKKRGGVPKKLKNLTGSSSVCAADISALNFSLEAQNSADSFGQYRSNSMCATGFRAPPGLACPRGLEDEVASMGCASMTTGTYEGSESFEIPAGMEVQGLEFGGDSDVNGASRWASPCVPDFQQEGIFWSSSHPGYWEYQNGQGLQQTESELPLIKKYYSHEPPLASRYSMESLPQKGGNKPVTSHLGPEMADPAEMHTSAPGFLHGFRNVFRMGSGDYSNEQRDTCNLETLSEAAGRRDSFDELRGDSDSEYEESSSGDEGELPTARTALEESSHQDCESGDGLSSAPTAMSGTKTVTAEFNSSIPVFDAAILPPGFFSPQPGVSPEGALAAAGSGPSPTVGMKANNAFIHQPVGASWYDQRDSSYTNSDSNSPYSSGLRRQSSAGSIPSIDAEMQKTHDLLRENLFKSGFGIHGLEQGANESSSSGAPKAAPASSNNSKGAAAQGTKGKGKGGKGAAKGGAKSRFDRIDEDFSTEDSEPSSSRFDIQSAISPLKYGGFGTGSMIKFEDNLEEAFGSWSSSSFGFATPGFATPGFATPGTQSAWASCQNSRAPSRNVSRPTSRAASPTREPRDRTDRGTSKSLVSSKIRFAADPMAKLNLNSMNASLMAVAEQRESESQYGEEEKGEASTVEKGESAGASEKSTEAAAKKKKNKKPYVKPVDLNSRFANANGNTTKGKGKGKGKSKAKKEKEAQKSA